ncbi:hypothetical protein RhiirA1_476537 [Rhizophagus irregularis]|uniref:Highly derived d5-like helicase-primase: PROVISIONAL n=2 Tax=Rhizophagus irregularis TaxID=588596 RepID=A0A2N0QUX6_9GLOM|nr:hypothetical protein RhiirA1_476537 [Rhizophagus irregularis]
MTQSELSEFLSSDAPAPYYCGFKASDVGEYSYKVRDDSVRPREILGTDNEDGIETILSDREGHSLHEIIDGDEPLRPIIDFDLLQEILDTIKPRLTRKEVQGSLILAFRKTCLEIFPKWDPKTISIATSSNAQKMSYHISTFGMRLKNIAQVSVFTELVRKKLPAGLQKKGIIDNIANIGSFKSFSLRMLGSPKYDKKTEEHVRVKRAIHPKDGTIFDFMIRPPNDDSRIIDSPLLTVSEPEVKRCPIKGNENTDANIENDQAEFDFIETLLRDNSIEGYTLSFPSDNIPDLFPLVRNSPSHCPICDREHENQAVTKGLILYRNINFLPYPLNSPVPNTKFFNLFLGFLAQPAIENNKEIMDPILWHVKNIICSGDERLNEYIWNWWAYLVQKPEKKPRSILVLKSTLQQCGKNIITDFIGDKVLGEHLHYATSDLEKILGRFNSPLQA